MEKERENKSMVPFSVGFVLAALRQHGIGQERPTLEARDKTM